MTIAFEKHGDGTDVVLVLHEWLATSTSYHEALRYWNQRDFTWILPNYRGYGASRAQRGHYTAKEMVDDVLAVADAAGASRFHVIAHSMSGMVAQLLSLEAGQRLRSIVFVAAVPGAGAQLEGDTLALFERAVDDETAWDMINTLTTGNRLGTGWAHARLAARLEIDPRAMAGYLQMWNRTDLSKRLRGLRVPAYCVSGAHDLDAFQEPAYRKTFGVYYDSVSYETLAGAGHFPMLETPPYFAGRVESFLRSQPAISS